MATDMPQRDVTGECEDECRDRVQEGEKQRQEALEKTEAETTEETPKAPEAEKRDNPPGELGGHV
jgi:hypothetical protein